MSKSHLRLVGGKPPEPKRVTNPVGAKRWITRVLSDKALTLGDRVVAAFIGSLFNPGKGYAFPSADRMAEQIGLSQRKVFYSIKRIAERGHFEVAPGGGKGIANAYYLIETVPPSAPLQPPKDDNREPQTMNARSEFGGSNSEPPFTQTMQIDAPNSERTFTPTRRTPTVECYNGPSDMNSSLTSRDALRSKSSARDVDFFSERKKGAREMTDEQFAQRKAQMIRELEATACKTHDEYLARLERLLPSYHNGHLSGAKAKTVRQWSYDCYAIWEETDMGSPTNGRAGRLYDECQGILQANGFEVAAPFTTNKGE